MYANTKIGATIIWAMFGVGDQDLGAAVCGAQVLEAYVEVAPAHLSDSVIKSFYLHQDGDSVLGWLSAYQHVRESRCTRLQMALYEDVTAGLKRGCVQQAGSSRQRVCGAAAICPLAIRISRLSPRARALYPLQYPGCLLRHFTMCIRVRQAASDDDSRGGSCNTVAALEVSFPHHWQIPRLARWPRATPLSCCLAYYGAGTARVRPASQAVRSL
jgi:hypothetical protein